MADKRILELRIHGVNNTKPEAILGLGVKDVEMVAGDELGSFWRPTSAGRDKSDIRDDTEREAYSWGEMARRSLGGDSGVSKAIGVASRAGWALLLPFGLVNVAYWTRALDGGRTRETLSEETTQPQGAETQNPNGDRQHSSVKKSWFATVQSWNGWGAATLRVAGLLVTLLFVVTASAVVLDLVAVQCYVGDTKVCTVLPSFVDFLTGWGQSRRLALLSLVPVVLVAGLLGLSAATRVRYEQPEPSMEKQDDAEGIVRFDADSQTPKADQIEAEASNARPDWPLLAVKGFWCHRDSTKVTARLHLAASMTVVALATAVHILFGFGESFHASPRAIVEIGIIVGAFVTLVLILISLIVRTDYAVDVQPSMGVGGAKVVTRLNWLINWAPVIAAFLLFAAQLGVLISLNATHKPTVRYLIGTSAAPAIVLTGLVVIAITALLWRLASTNLLRHLPNGVALGLILLIGWMALEEDHLRRVVATLAAAAILIAFLTVRWWLIPGQRAAAWSGSAPGVFLLLATLLAMLLSSAVATAAGNWLNSSNSAASLADSRNPESVYPTPCAFWCPKIPPPNLEVSLPYIWFGAIGLPLILLTVIVVGGASAIKSSRWDGSPAGTTTALRNSVLQRRRFAAATHRAERYIMWLVGAATVGILLSIGITAWGERPEYKKGNDYTPFEVVEKLFLDGGMVLLAGVGLLLIGLAVGGGAVGGARPLGLAWDLMCFLPRAGHPLAPPCYAERAVPELAERCDSWLQTSHDHRIVLSAHSLGSVLAAAVVLSPRIADSDKTRVSLLTYGSQLRAYFSRIFPDLLGPEILGIQECTASSLRTVDPWENKINAHPAHYTFSNTGECKYVCEANDAISIPVDEKSVAGVLSRGTGQLRWRNLWRRTDYLGFPVFGYAKNPIDIYAEEVVTVHFLAEVQTHSDYPKAADYGTALTALSPAAPQTPS